MKDAVLILLCLVPVVYSMYAPNVPSSFSFLSSAPKASKVGSILRSDCDYHGINYTFQQMFNPTPCKECRCQYFGRVICRDLEAQCPRPRCRDPYYKPDQCCPVCYT